jgi:Ion channel
LRAPRRVGETCCALIRVVELSRRMFSLEGIRDAAVITTIVVLASGVAFASVEHGHGQHPNLTPWDGVWWAAATVMTVGPGDYAPVTVAGRAISLLVMTVGIGFVALLTAAAAQRFIKSTTDNRERSSAQILQRLDDVVERLDRLERSTEEVPEPLLTRGRTCGPARSTNVRRAVQPALATPEPSRTRR